jgi:NADH:ubiquinone oxidoreductase subunit 4 (subunit M)
VFTYSLFLYKLEALNLTYVFLIDGISIYFLLLTLLLFIICVLIAWNLRYKLREFLIILLSINVFLVHVFAITDLIFFYIFFEALLIPMFLLIGV